MNAPDNPRRPGSDDKVVDLAAHRASGGAEHDPAFEARLARALAVPVPEGLADRILLHQTTLARRERTGGAPFGGWRAAAVLALAIGAGVGLYGFNRPVSALPDMAVAHLPHEPYAMSARGKVAPTQLRALFGADGIKLADDPEGVNYMMRCDLGDETWAIHMVMQREEGPVTVFYVPGHREPQRSAWQRAAVLGRSVPLGEGTLVLLGANDASFDAIESQWQRLIDPAQSEALAAR
jgi:hypothetical protein